MNLTADDFRTAGDRVRQMPRVAIEVGADENGNPVSSVGDISTYLRAVAQMNRICTLPMSVYRDVNWASRAVGGEPTGTGAVRNAVAAWHARDVLDADTLEILLEPVRGLDIFDEPRTSLA